MSVKKGLIGFGMSAGLAAGSFYALQGWEHADREAAIAYDCGYQKDYVAPQICETVDFSNNGIAEADEINNAYNYVYKLGIIAAGITFAISFGSVMLGEDDLRRRSQQHNITVDVNHLPVTQETETGQV